LLLIIRTAFEPVAAGGVLEVRSREISVKEDLPAWCRMVGHTLLGSKEQGSGYTHYALKKRGGDAALAADLEQARNHVWQVRVRWTAGVRSRAFARNHSFEIGQPASFDTEDPAPSAVEYLLAAVGGALSSGLQWRLSRRGVTVRNLEVSLKARSQNILVFLGVEASGEPALAGLEGKLYVAADVEPAVLERELAETLRSCPVTRSLVEKVPVDIQLKIV
jgi:uncharacterized OsmC-like protein/TusA-related sulfurtransferase